MRRVLSMVGLGLLAGAVLHRAAEAQVRDTVKTRRDTTLVVPIPPRADSLLRDSLAKRDSIKRAAPRHDQGTARACRISERSRGRPTAAMESRFAVRDWRGDSR